MLRVSGVGLREDKREPEIVAKDDDQRLHQEKALEKCRGSGQCGKYLDRVWFEGGQRMQKSRGHLGCWLIIH